MQRNIWYFMLLSFYWPINFCLYSSLLNELRGGIKKSEQFFIRDYIFYLFLLCFAFQQKKTAQSMCRSTEWYLQDFKFSSTFSFRSNENFLLQVLKIRNKNIEKLGIESKLKSNWTLIRRMLLKMRLHNIYGYEFVTVKKNHFINTQAERKLMTGILVKSHIPI